MPRQTRGGKARPGRASPPRKARRGGVGALPPHNTGAKARRWRGCSARRRCAGRAQRRAPAHLSACRGRNAAPGRSPARPGEAAAQSAAKGVWGPLAPTWSRRRGPQMKRLQRREALRRARAEGDAGSPSPPGCAGRTSPTSGEDETEAPPLPAAPGGPPRQAGRTRRKPLPSGREAPALSLRRARGRRGPEAPPLPATPGGPPRQAGRTTGTRPASPRSRSGCRPSRRGGRRGGCGARRRARRRHGPSAGRRSRHRGG
jgi:hypothetical protein